LGALIHCPRPRPRNSTLGKQEIARRLGLRSVVRETLKRTEGVGLSWTLPKDMSDGALEATLYSNLRSKRGYRRSTEPDGPGCIAH
jgi:hypothetical protein